MDEAERLCDRLVVIDHGQVVAQGTPSGLIDALDGGRVVRLRPAPVDRARAHDELARLTGTDPAVSAVTEVGDELEVTGDRRVLFSVVQALSAAELLPDDVRTVPRTLEDVFVRVTGRAYDPRAAADLEGASR
jgi:ABC-2 type transport system ATP-binding protein